MEKSYNNIDASSGQLIVKLSNEELQPYYDNAFQSARQNIDLKGFRKGKVPMNMIKKMFGPQIEQEALEDVISEKMNEIFKEDKINVIGQPKLSKLDKNEDGVEFFLDFEKTPDFELKDYRGVCIDEPVHRVSDEEVDEEIARICLNNGNIEATDQVRDENHIVRITLQEVDKSTGLVIIGEQKQETSVFLGSETVIPELRSLLLNTVVGDSFNFNPGAADTGAPDKLYEIKILEIQKIVPVEFNNEFVEKYTNGRFLNTEDFQQEIGFQLQEKWDKKSKEQMEQQIVNKIVEMHDFEPPPTLVEHVLQSFIDNLKKQYKDNSNSNELTVENMSEGLKPLAARTVKWELIREKIIEKEGLEVEESDIEELVNYNLGNQKLDRETITKALMSNRNIADNIIAKKVMDFLLDFAITQETDFEGNPLENEQEDL